MQTTSKPRKEMFYSRVRARRQTAGVYPGRVAPPTPVYVPRGTAGRFRGRAPTRAATSLCHQTQWAPAINSTTVFTSSAIPTCKYDYRINIFIQFYWMYFIFFNRQSQWAFKWEYTQICDEDYIYNKNAIHKIVFKLFCYIYS